MRMRYPLALVMILSLSPAFAENRPQLLDPRLKLELVAEHPAIMTPTGIAVDAGGRIFAIENNTHQRPANYKGPVTDRIRIYSGFDAAGAARRIETFVEGFKDSMALTFGPDGVLYLATRSRLIRLPDATPKEIVRLETKGDYPHNGLSGFAWDANGDLVFGIGENLGEPYRLVGSDGSTLTGGGEGGNVFRCRPDGSKLSRIATGFWNPFGMTYDAEGRLFVVDNDPDARGPCRLLHVPQGGDFGYRFRYGRKGTHPFQCWNGELPGTLPMTAGTSEAPSGIVACDFTSMSKLFPGELLVTSWGDHTIERFHLAPRGASVAGLSKTLVRGGENFRPVAFAVESDGSVIFTDWVDKSYPVHGKGRIWRLRADPSAAGPIKARPAERQSHSESEWFAIFAASTSPAARMDAILHLDSTDHLKTIIPLLADPDPYLASAALDRLGRPGKAEMLLASLEANSSPALRTGILLALRRTGEPAARQSVERFLADADPGVRRAAIQWAAEERWPEYRDAIRPAASRIPVNADLFYAWLAANDLFSGKPAADGDKRRDEQAIAILKNPKEPILFRILALRSIAPVHPALPTSDFPMFMRETNEGWRKEVIRTLTLRSDAKSQAVLQEIAGDASIPLALRLDAIAGLGQSADSPPTKAFLQKAAAIPELAPEAMRSLRKPAVVTRTLEEWRPLLATPGGDARAGERLFYHARGPGCYKCHSIDHRGSQVGPDLSTIGRATSRAKLIESILEPSKEIAPAFTAWRITTRDGKERIGLIAGETFDSFVTVVDNQGKIEKIARTEIEERVAQSKSIMPDDLASQMTPQDFLDLLAYLSSRQ